MTEFLHHVISGIAIGCGFALVGSGLVTIYRVTGVVNFAQGMFAVVGGMTAAAFLSAGLWHGVAELAAVAVAGLVGAFTWALALGRRGTSPMTALIVTLAISFLAYAVLVAAFGDTPRSTAGLSGMTSLMGVPVRRHHLLVIAVTAVVFVLLWLFLTRTYLGKALTACATNPYAARVVGIPVAHMALFAFVLAGVLGGLAGVLLTPLRPMSFNSDVSLIVHGFAAAILGGLTRPMIALAGGVLLGVVEALVAGYGNAAYQTLVALVVMLTVMVWHAARRPTVHQEVTA